jgi:hypothetical protein
MTYLHKHDSGKVNNDWCIIRPHYRQIRRLFIPESQVGTVRQKSGAVGSRIRGPDHSTTNYIQLLVKLRVKEVYILNRHRYSLTFLRGLS